MPARKRSTAETYAIPCNFSRRATWASPDGRNSGHFTPRGNPVFSSKRLERRCSTRANPVLWESDVPTKSARLFVGFNVKSTPTYSMDYLVNLVKKVRLSQKAAPDSSFLYQKGIYSHQDGSGEVVTEDGAQVIILHLDESKSEEQFRSQIVTLAETICEDMKQETVIVEFQEGGIAKKVIGVHMVPKKKGKRK